jgi:acetyl-CoA C-acetyltransferase
MKEIVIASPVRTAIGDFGGALRTVTPLDLAQHVIGEVLQRSQVQAEWINKVIFGCCFGAVEQNIARNAAYKAGIPEEAPAFTINIFAGNYFCHPVNLLW